MDHELSLDTFTIFLITRNKNIKKLNYNLFLAFSSPYYYTKYTEFPVIIFIFDCFWQCCILPEIVEAISFKVL